MRVVAISSGSGSGCRLFVSEAALAQQRLLAFLEAIKDELHPRRDAQLIKYPEKVVSHDLLLARGYSSLQVAIICYAVAIAFAGISWVERRMAPVEAAVVSALSFAALAVVEIRLGSLQSANLRRPAISSRAAVKQTRSNSVIAR